MPTVTRDRKLKELVNGPRDRRRRRLENHPRRHSAEIAADAAATVDGGNRLREPVDDDAGVAADRAGGMSRLGIEKGLTDVQGRGSGRCNGTGRGPGHDVRQWVILPHGVDEVLSRLVDDEMKAHERHVHGELGPVAAVERPDALGVMDRTNAVNARLVWTVEDLHSLFDDCNTQQVIKAILVHQTR